MDNLYHFRVCFIVSVVVVNVGRNLNVGVGGYVSTLGAQVDEREW